MEYGDERYGGNGAVTGENPIQPQEAQDPYAANGYGQNPYAVPPQWHPEVPQQMYAPPVQQGYVQPSYPAQATGGYVPQQVLYTAPMAPQEPLPSYPTPQMAREGLKAQEQTIGEKKAGKVRPWIIVLILLLVAALALGGYFLFGRSAGGYTAKEVVEALYNHQLPVSDPYLYTAKDDPEGLLGEMNQYTSKASWTDRSLSGAMTTLEAGGIAEVFATEALAQARVRQLAAMPFDEAGYTTQANRVVLRLSTLYGEDDVDAYTEVLRKMFAKQDE